MKRAFILGLTLATALVLAACGNNTTSETDNGGKTTSASTVNTTTKSSVQSSASDEVTNGQLLKVGEWKTDDQQGKMVLVKINILNKTLTTGSNSIILKDFKLFEVTPKDSQQKQYASFVFESEAGVTTPYYEIQIQYQIKNAGATEIEYYGLKSIVTATGQQLDSSGGMSDQGLGDTVAAGATKDTVVHALIPTADKDKLTKLTLNFGSFIRTADYEELGTLPSTTIELN